MMYDVIKRLWLAGKITDKGLVSAVTRGWLTQEQADSILQSGAGGV